MKTLSGISVLGAIVAAASCSQPSGDQNNRCGGQIAGPPPRDPFLTLFDTDADDEISAREIDAAEDILRSLDQDRNGALTRNELPRPPRPEDRGHEGFHHTSGDGQRPDFQHGRAKTVEPSARRRPAIQTNETSNSSEDVAVGTVLFRGGFETDPRDGGRPVALIAAALDVEPQVFRDAFRGVNPARGGDPSPALARRNKQVLMDALGPHGITNERLDEVSNYYRYRPEAGEMWPRRPARAVAIFENGELAGVRVTDEGAGYLVAPEVVVAGYESVRVTAEIAFGNNLRTNGRIVSLRVAR